MKKFLILLTLISGANAFATSPMKCDIKNLGDAEACIERLALKMESFEEPNDGLATANGEALANALAAQEYSPSNADLDKIRNADFVGVIVLHDDEHHLLYYVLNKGLAAPDFIMDMNIADFEIDSKFKGEMPSAADYLIGHDSAADIDVYADIETALAEAKN